MRNSRRIRSLQDLNLIANHCNHVLTLFSGGLDSTYVLSQLFNKRCKVTALAVDVGEAVDTAQLEQLTEQFKARLTIVDGRELFAQQAVLPAIAANARYMGVYPISSSLSRPVIAKIAVETASKLGCDAIVHTANQSQNSLRRLNGAISQLGYLGFFGTPYEYSAISRPQKIAELAASGLRHFEARSISGDANLWCREFESGTLDNPEDFEIPRALLRWTQPHNLVGVDTQLSITFERGKPVALNEKALPPIELIALANAHAGSFGIGRYAGLEHLEQGEKVLEVREAPAACVLMEAFRHLETATLDAELLREKLVIEQLWVREAIEGRWYGPLRLAADSFIAEISKQVSGTVKFNLRPGAADVCAIRAKSPRYLTDRDQWEKRVARSRASRELELAVES